MSCQYTGARVWLPDYGLISQADLFQVAEGTVLVRFPEDPRKHGVYVYGPENATHVVHCNPASRSDVMLERGIILVQSQQVESTTKGKG